MRNNGSYKNCSGHSYSQRHSPASCFAFYPGYTSPSTWNGRFGEAIQSSLLYYYITSMNIWEKRKAVPQKSQKDNKKTEEKQMLRSLTKTCGFNHSWKQVIQPWFNPLMAAPFFILSLNWQLVINNPMNNIHKCPRHYASREDISCSVRFGELSNSSFKLSEIRRRVLQLRVFITSARESVQTNTFYNWELSEGVSKWVVVPVSFSMVSDMIDTNGLIVIDFNGTGFYRLAKGRGDQRNTYSLTYEFQYCMYDLSLN